MFISCINRFIIDLTSIDLLFNKSWIETDTKFKYLSSNQHIHSLLSIFRKSIDSCKDCWRFSINKNYSIPKMPNHIPKSLSLYIYRHYPKLCRSFLLRNFYQKTVPVIQTLHDIRNAINFKHPVKDTIPGVYVVCLK